MCLLMPRARRSSPRPTSDPPSLEQVVEDLTVEVEKLTGQVEVLRISIDDLRQEVEWAIRNIYRPAWAPTQNPASPSQQVHSDTNGGREDHAEDLAPPVDSVPASRAPGSVQPKGLWD